MQVDMGMNMTNKWATAGRVPPLDLTSVTAVVCGQRDSRRAAQVHQWNHNPTPPAEEHLSGHHQPQHQHQHQQHQQQQDDGEATPMQQLPHQFHYNRHNQQHQRSQLLQQQQQPSTNGTNHCQYPPQMTRTVARLPEQMTEIDLVHGADGLPIDPRDWTRADVWSWLTNLALSEGLQPTGDLVLKFPMNGKALCLMSVDMYLARVPHGGKMLYRDFRVRLARAMNL